MAAPAVQQAIESSTNTAGTSHVVDLPTATAGQLLLIILDKGSTSATINTHASLTELLDEASANGLYIAYRWMDGSEPSTYTLTSSASTRSARIAYRISGAINPAAVEPQIGTTGTGTSATPDPPASANPPSSKDYLFIAFAGMAGEEADDDTWGNTPPTNYTPSPPRQKSCGTAGTNLGGLIVSAERQLTTGSAENPGTFGVDTSAAWRSQTITVHPQIPQLVTPTTLAATTATFAPTVTATANQRVVPTTASLTTSAFAPTAAAPRLATPPTASLSLTTFAPDATATAGTVATPGTAGLSLTAFAPSVGVTNHQRITPGVSSLSLTAFAPTANATANVWARPDSTALVASTFAPTVTASDHKTVTPGTVALSLTSFVPVVAAGITVVTATGSLSLSAFAPTVTLTEHQLVTPAAAALTLQTFAATILAPQSAVPSTAVLALSAFAPSVELHGAGEVQPSPASLSLTGHSPSVLVAYRGITAGLVSAGSLSASVAGNGGFGGTIVSQGAPVQIDLTETD